MLKEYLKEKGISIYSLAKESGVPYSTVNDLCNNKVDIENCKAGILKALSDKLEISMNELYELSSYQRKVDVEEYGVEASIKVRGQRYHTIFNYNGEPVDIELCKVSEVNGRYVEEFASWSVEDYLDEKFVEGEV